MSPQIFHTLYHTDENVLLGAPTGSGKTISAELAILHAFAAHPDRKVVYIAPLKVRQKRAPWRCPSRISALALIGRSPIRAERGFDSVVRV